jgi:hypothetical protein
MHNNIELFALHTAQTQLIIEQALENPHLHTQIFAQSDGWLNITGYEARPLSNKVNLMAGFANQTLIIQ